MAKITIAKESFTGGELSPRLFGRTKLQRYDQAAKVMENFLVQPHGGLTRRPGTRFVREVKTSANQTRLIPFQFNVEQSYILEFGDQYFRVYKDGGIVVSSGVPVEFTTPYRTADLTELKFAQTADIMYLVHPDYQPRKITRTGHTTWTITTVDLARGPMGDTNATSTTLTASGRSGSVTITASANTFASTDVGRLVKLHEGFAKITSYTSATSVDATVQELADGRSELMPGYTATTISFHEGDPDATGLEHNDRIQDSDGNFIDQGFKAGQRITTSGTSSNNKSAMLIVDVTDTVITLAPGIDLADESAGSSFTINGDLIADNRFQLGAISDTTGWPRAIAFYEQRLVLAGTTAQPQTIFFSQGGDFENFERGTDGDDGLVYTIGSNEVNVIRYLSSQRQLLVGTSGGEFIVRASGFDEPLNPTNTQIKQQTSFGSANVQPIQAGNATLFIQRAKRKIREMQFNADSDGYVAPDMTILAEHVTEGGIEEMAYQQEPDSVAWTVRADGIMACMTYRRDEQVVAWHRHIFGGTDVEVESVAVIPGDIDEDQVWLIVKRTINGATKRYVEYLKNFDFGDDETDAFFVDSGLSYEGVTNTLNGDITNAATTITLTDATDFTTSGAIKIGTEVITYTGKSSNDLTGCVRAVEGAAAAHTSGDTVTQVINGLGGLSHLEAEDVSILADGATHPNETVSSGEVTLDRYAAKVHAGLNFISRVETLRIDEGSQLGSAQGKVKRISDVTVRLYRTIGMKVGPSVSALDIVPFRSSATGMGSNVGLFTGDKFIEFAGGFDADTTIVVQQDQPLPMSILGLYFTVSVFDR